MQTLPRTLATTREIQTPDSPFEKFSFPLRAENADARAFLKMLAAEIQKGEPGDVCTVCQIDPVEVDGALSIRLVGKLYKREAGEIVRKAVNKANKI